VERKFK